ncbi:MAG: hypothetical protein ACLQHK_01745, partial [Gallionellaceae bacterium]
SKDDSQVAGYSRTSLNMHTQARPTAVSRIIEFSKRHGNLATSSPWAKITMEGNNRPRLARLELLRSNWDQQPVSNGLNNNHEKSGKAL